MNYVLLISLIPMVAGLVYTEMKSSHTDLEVRGKHYRISKDSKKAFCLACLFGTFAGVLSVNLAEASIRVADIAGFPKVPGEVVSYSVEPVRHKTTLFYQAYLECSYDYNRERLTNFVGISPSASQSADQVDNEVKRALDGESCVLRVDPVDPRIAYLDGIIRRGMGKAWLIPIFLLGVSIFLLCVSYKCIQMY